MSDETRALDLDAIRARADAATYGPWLTGPSWAGENAVLTSEGHPIAVCGYGAEADAEYIAHSREDIRALLAEVDQLRGYLNRAGLGPA